MTASTMFGQNKIFFDYDIAGNQINREYCINCISNTATNKQAVADIKPEDMQKFNPEDDFSYYPNPVKEELFLKWNNKLETFIISITIFNPSGVLLKSLEKQDNLESQNISFLQYPTGLYIISLGYSNGKKKTIKIIKE